MRLLCAPLLALAVMVGSGSGAAPAGAQAPGGGGANSDADASIAPRGSFRLRALTSWTRYDAVYGLSPDGRPVPLGALFSTDSLGTPEVPALAPNEAALRAAVGNPSLRLNLGRLTTAADSRVVNVPLEMQYGVTSRIALSVMVPFVQTRATVIAGMNTRCSGVTCLPEGVLANVGTNPANYFGTTGLIGQLQSAESRLRTALGQCQTNPGAAVCGRQAEAQQLLATSATFATNIGALYGTGSSNTGQPFVPITGGALDALIRQQIAAYNAQFRDLLGSSQDLVTSVPTGAGGPIGVGALEQLAGPQFGVGFDSLRTTKRIGIGDIELGLAYKLFDALSDSTAGARAGFRARAALQGVVRLGTGAPSDPTLPFDIGTGQGQTDIEGRAAMDLRVSRRLGGTISGLYSYQLTSAHLKRAPQAGGLVFPLVPPYAADWKPGNVLQLEVAPRFLATEYLAVTAHYLIRSVAADLVTPTRSTVVDTTLAVRALPAPYVSLPSSTEQRLGIGFTYSALESYANGRSPVPLEMFFVHQETVHASGFTPKYFRDQLGFRLYYQWRRAEAPPLQPAVPLPR